MAGPHRGELHCSCYRLRKTTRRVTSLYDEALAPLDLTSTQMSILVVLARGNPQRMSALADALGMENSTVSRTLRPMIARGLLEVSPDADRRARLVALTGAGTSLLTRSVPLWRAAQARVQQALGAELTQLHQLLAALDTRLGSKM